MPSTPNPLSAAVGATPGGAPQPVPLVTRAGVLNPFLGFMAVPPGFRGLPGFPTTQPSGSSAVPPPGVCAAPPPHGVQPQRAHVQPPPGPQAMAVVQQQPAAAAAATAGGEGGGLREEDNEQQRLALIASAFAVW